MTQKIVIENKLKQKDDAIFFDSNSFVDAMGTYYVHLYNTMFDYLQDDLSKVQYKAKDYDPHMIPGHYFKDTPYLILPHLSYMIEHNITDWNIGYYTVSLHYTD